MGVPGIPKYTYMASLRGGHEKSFDTFYAAFDYVLSMSTTDFIVDYLNDYLGEGVFTRNMVNALLETKETYNLFESCLDYLVSQYYMDKFKPITENMWYLGHGWRLIKKVQYE